MPEMPEWKAAALWLLVVGVLIGLQLDPQVCSSNESRALSLFVGYAVVSALCNFLEGKKAGKY